MTFFDCHIQLLESCFSVALLLSYFPQLAEAPCETAAARWRWGRGGWVSYRRWTGPDHTFYLSSHTAITVLKMHSSNFSFELIPYAAHLGVCPHRCTELRVKIPPRDLLLLFPCEMRKFWAAPHHRRHSALQQYCLLPYSGTKPCSLCTQELCKYLLQTPCPKKSLFLWDNYSYF